MNIMAAVSDTATEIYSSEVLLICIGKLDTRRQWLDQYMDFH